MPRDQHTIPLELRRQSVGKSFYPGEVLEIDGKSFETTIWVGELGGGMQRPQVTLPGPITLMQKLR